MIGIRIAGAIGVGLLLVIIGLSARLLIVERQNGKLNAALIECGRTLDNERQAVRDKAAIARAEDAANKARVERDQVTVSKEEISGYQNRISDLRRRADALGMQLAKARAAAGGGGSAPVPGLPAPAGGADGAAGDHDAGAAADDLAYRLACAEQGVRLETLQQWNRRQAAIAP